MLANVSAPGLEMVAHKLGMKPRVKEIQVFPAPECLHEIFNAVLHNPLEQNPQKNMNERVFFCFFFFLFFKPQGITVVPNVEQITRCGFNLRNVQIVPLQKNVCKLG
jgi:hypothetical protein